MVPRISKGIDPVVSSSPILPSLCKNLLEMSQLIKLLKGVQLANEFLRATFQLFPQKEWCKRLPEPQTNAWDLSSLEHVESPWEEPSPGADRKMKPKAYSGNLLLSGSHAKLQLRAGIEGRESWVRFAVTSICSHASSLAGQCSMASLTRFLKCC